MFMNNKGAGLMHAIILIFATASLTIIISKNLMSMNDSADKFDTESGKVLAGLNEVDDIKDIVVGDKIYQVIPDTTDLSDKYDVVDTIQFKPDKLICDIDTKYDYVNFVVLAGNQIVTYQLDPKTRFVGIDMVDSSTEATTEIRQAITREYPVLKDLSTVDMGGNYKLTLGQVGDAWKIIRPQTYETVNNTYGGRISTQFEVKLKDSFTDVYIFKSSLTEPAPILTSGTLSELLMGIEDLPHYRVNREGGTIVFSSNFLDTEIAAIGVPEGTLDVNREVPGESLVINERKTKGNTLHYKTIPDEVPLGTNIPSELKILRKGVRNKYKIDNQVNLGGK